MKYFGYRIPESLTFLIGTDSKQIMNTMEYYKTERSKDVVVPSSSDIVDIESIRIECVFPMYCKDHFLDVDVEDNFIFRVNANAMGYVQEIAQYYGEFKRGDLYKFVPPLLNGGPFGPINLYFLPESIMEGLKQYDWGQHDEQLNGWLDYRESVLNDMMDKGYLKWLNVQLIARRKKITVLTKTYEVSSRSP